MVDTTIRSHMHVHQACTYVCAIRILRREAFCLEYREREL